VDDTSHTNNEKPPHMTFTGQTSSGHVFTWMRVFLPNKTAGAFCWMFHIVLPKLLGDSLLKRINVIISDGDSQEISQLDNAIIDCYPHMQRLHCGRHIVEKGWQKHCPGEHSVDVPFREPFKHLLKHVKKWIYSWMKPGYCETEDKYHLSKVILIHYLKTEHVFNICGKNHSIPNQIIKFITAHVFPHENHYIFWRQYNIQHDDELNNCSHEGRNAAMKSHVAAVLPGHSIASAGRRLHFQAQLKYTESKKLAADEFHSREVWCDLPSIAPVCKCGQALIYNEWVAWHKYIV
jgi:hypothetical protein